jgi:tetraacyldisaccharide 4'-kinase
LVTALASHYKRPGVLLRGYGRQSRGLFVVSDGKNIQCDVLTSGDEAMIYAQKLPNAVVIVSECRECAIQLFEQMGCEVLFLDDGYSKHHIKKLDLLIDVKTANNACLPSGPFRERLWQGKAAVVLREGEDFTRKTKLVDATEKMALVTAIARPERLERFLPEVCSRHYFKDHHFFTKDELESVLQTSGASSLLVTYKDYVKMADFGLPLSLLDLNLDLDPSLVKRVNQYIEGEI